MSKTTNISFKMVGQFDNLTSKRNGDITVRFKFPYSELPNYLKLFQLLNQNITISAKIGIEDPKSLGLFTLNSFKVDKDGEATITFDSSTAYVEHDAIERVSETTMNQEIVSIMCNSTIELEDEEPTTESSEKPVDEWASEDPNTDEADWANNGEQSKESPVVDEWADEEESVESIASELKDASDEWGTEEADDEW